MAATRPPWIQIRIATKAATGIRKGPMQLSHASSYALHALVHLAGQPAGKPIASYLVAEARGIPARYVLKVLKSLVGARILHSLKGANGGYWLARLAKEITLLEVVEAVDGPIRGDAPPVGQGADAAALDRRLQQACDDAAALVRERLGKVTLAELARAK
jgi:Rrf2 family protein